MPRFGGIPIEENSPKPSGPRFGGILVEEVEQDTDDGFSAVEMVKNIPSSAAQLGKDLYQAVTNPIDTAKAVASTAAGGLYKANEAAKGVLPEFMTTPIGGGDKTFGEGQAGYAEALADAIKGRYGSGDAAMNTLEKDPVGAVADLASLLSGAGAVTKSPALAKAGAKFDPLSLPGTLASTKLGSKIGSMVANNASKLVPEFLTPTGMYKSAAKFNTTTPTRSEITETALANRIMPTEAGLEKLEGLISGLSGKIEELIKEARDTGQRVDKDELFKYIDELKSQKGGVRLGAQKDVETINSIIDGFSDHLSSIGKSTLDADDLQFLKLEADKDINWDRKNLKGNLTKEQTYKAVRKAAKEAIEGISPNIKEVNQQLGELYELQKYLPQKVGRVENRDLMSIGAPLKIMAGSTVSPGIGTAVGTASAIGDLPKFKARTAIEMRRAGDAVKKLAETLDNSQELRSVRSQPDLQRLARILADPRLRQALIQSGRLTEKNQQEPPQ